MSGNRNSYEERLRQLTERFNLLRVRLEATAYQIKLMGGTLPYVDERYLNMLDEHTKAMEKEMEQENKWENQVIAAMRGIGHPCNAKEISEIIFSNQDVYSLSSIHIHVRNALRILGQNHVIGVLPKNQRKYFLEENIEDIAPKWYKDIEKKN